MFQGQIFEKGEGNNYVEPECLSKLASKKLPKFFHGREISFFNTFSNIIENNTLQLFWNISEDQKRIFSIYCNKIDHELKATNNFSTVRDIMKNDTDFWSQGDEFMKWRFLDILDSFSGYT